ncbi:MAG: APC family permease [Verrucomicrobia bacterium]|nr:APC family permease [Verrucomicrobiota bacterium]
MKWYHLVFGRRLASSEDKQERVNPLEGVAVFGLDGLGSAAYGPEAALTILLPIGLAAPAYGLPILVLIVILLTIVYFSYRQTIAAYPNGAGSYTVAKENLGDRLGVLAAVALMIDYTLNTAVGISTGVNALVSAVPACQPYALWLCLFILFALTYLNVRGVRESAFAFTPPTCLFVFCLAVVIVIGLAKIVMSGGHPQPVAPPPQVTDVREPVTFWLLIRAFAAGCTAMTGVEAVSNGVQAFREPVVPAAQRCLTLIVVTLAFLLAGVAVVIPFYHITATDPTQAGYQSVLSSVTGAVCGRGIFYYLTILSILVVLCLSANTSFAGFPRLCQRVAHDGFLPYAFAIRGRRLVYTQGIWILTILAAALLIAFNGVTDRLIPLFAVGAFLTFTLSQAGMVRHWVRSKEKRAHASKFINGIGAVATGASLVVIIVAKFMEGAWLVVIVLPLLYGVMFAIKKHFLKISREIDKIRPVRFGRVQPPLAVVVVDSWNSVAQKALKTAYNLSPEVEVLHIEQEDSKGELAEQWERSVKPSLRAAGLPEPRLVLLPSPFRRVITPVLNHVWELEARHRGRPIAVVIPELVDRWYMSFLNNQQPAMLKTMLLLKGHPHILVVSVPWYLEEVREEAQDAAQERGSDEAGPGGTAEVSQGV